MITESDILANMELAANGWPGISHLHSSHLRAIRIIAIATHNTCAACGDELGSEEINLCHIVGEGTHGKGVAPFNVYIGHKSCNDIDREVCMGDPFKIVESMARPDLILSRIPNRKEAFAIVHEYDNANKARRAMERQSRMS